MKAALFLILFLPSLSQAQGISILDLAREGKVEFTFSHAVTLKMHAENGRASVEDDVWWQDGKVYYSNADLDYSKTYCKLDTSPDFDSIVSDTVISAATTRISSSVEGRLSIRKGFTTQLNFKDSAPIAPKVGLSNFRCETPSSDIHEVTENEVDQVTGGDVTISSVN